MLAKSGTSNINTSGKTVNSSSPKMLIGPLGTVLPFVICNFIDSTAGWIDLFFGNTNLWDNVSVKLDPRFGLIVKTSTQLANNIP